jgi:hypothetical protein
MAIEIEWTWGPMRVENVDQFTDVVVGINWLCMAWDRENNVYGKNSGFILAPTPDPANYLAISDVTAAVVQSWIDSNFDKAAVEAECLGYVNQQLQPVIRSMAVPPGLNITL